MQAFTNGIHTSNGHGAVIGHELEIIPSQDELAHELPDVLEGQVPLGELLSRVVQSIYAELTEMAETLPNMSDSARKRTIADWVVKTKKQVVKLYAILKWSRDAGDVQKAMNITAFLLDQNGQFEDATRAITSIRESLAPARLRNHDLLTSLDVLTTGTYQRLPAAIKKFFIAPEPLSDDEISKTLKDMEFVIKYRLRMHEIVPIEMSQFVIEGGRVHFNVPNLFATSLGLRGAEDNDGWFFVHVEFLHNIGGDLKDGQEFPRIPTGALKGHITSEADNRLAYYKPNPSVEPSSRPQLTPDTVDAPLVRLFNFLQMMALTYQLEILFYQASRMRSLGWREYLKLQRSNDGKSFMASYWLRPAPLGHARAQANSNRPRIPLIGGTLTFSLAETYASQQAGGGPFRSPRDRILANLQRHGKVKGAAPSDEVETFRIDVKWEPTPGALGVPIPPELAQIDPDQLKVRSESLDFEALLQVAIEKHIDCILSVYQHTLLTGSLHSIFAMPGEVLLARNEGANVLRIYLGGGEVAIVSIDSRTGRITIRDVGDLAAAGKGPRFAMVSERVNENPLAIFDAIVHLRYSTIIESLEQKAHYLGLQTFRTRNLTQIDYDKLGHPPRHQLFIQLANLPKHYLVIYIADVGFTYALVWTKDKEYSSDNMINDVAWLDVNRIRRTSQATEMHDSQRGLLARPDFVNATKSSSPLGDFNGFFLQDRFQLDTDTLREIHTFCCARAVYRNVENQLKLRGIIATHVDQAVIPSGLAFLQSSLARSIPGLCVKTSDILAGAPAAEAAMSNIRVIPLHWWSSKKTQVVTCVKLRYVQQPVGKRAGTSTVIRPSKRIIYDTREAVVCFLSDNVMTCVDEFLEGWSKVSKIVVIAREIAQMANRPGWEDVRLLSFDLQTVEFTYSQDYTVSITCSDELLTTSGGAYDLSFSRVPKPRGKSRMELDPFSSFGEDNDDALDNPHEVAEPFIRHVIRHGPHLSSSLLNLVSLLRDSLPVVCVIDSIRKAAVSGRDKDAQNIGVDTFAKAAGWFRVLYGDMRHALDLRLLSNRRVLLLDASHASRPGGIDKRNLTNRQQTPAPATPILAHKSKPSIGGTNDSPSKQKHVTFAPSAEKASNSGRITDNFDESGLLLPIPNFAELIREALKDAIQASSIPSSSELPGPATSIDPTQPVSASTFSGRDVAALDVGVVCRVEDIDILALRVHARVVKALVDLNHQKAAGTAAAVNATPLAP